MAIKPTLTSAVSDILSSAQRAAARRGLELSDELIILEALLSKQHSTIQYLLHQLGVDTDELLGHVKALIQLEVRSGGQES